MRRSLALVPFVLLALAGCSSESDSTSRPTSTRYVTPGKPPLVNSFDIDPADGSFLMTTNKGFYRITKDGKKITRQTSEVTAKGKTSPLGTFLAVSATPEGTLLGSGHPDDKKAGLPQFLGFMESKDDGKTWKVVSRLGLADLHVMRQQFGRLYGFDAVTGALLVSEDGGRNWTEHPTPRELIEDFVIDPADENHILAAAVQ